MTALCCMIVHTSLYLNLPSDTCHATFSGGVPACVSCLRRPDPYSSKQQTNKIKLRWALFVTYTIIQSIMRSEMCFLHLTHPSGAVGSRLCSVRGAVGGLVPCSRVSPQPWTLPAGAGTLTGVVCFCSPTSVKKSFCRSKMHLPFEDGSKEEPVFPYRKSNQGWKPVILMGTA